MRSTVGPSNANYDGHEDYPLGCTSGSFQKIEMRYQNGQGLLNARLNCGSDFTPWANDNGKGDIKSFQCIEGTRVVGFAGFESGTEGLVNMRIYCGLVSDISNTTSSADINTSNLFSIVNSN